MTFLMFMSLMSIHCTQCEEHKKNAQYGSAKTYGKVALGLNIANIIYTAVVALVIISAVLGSVIAGKYIIINNYIVV